MRSIQSTLLNLSWRLIVNRLIDDLLIDEGLRELPYKCSAGKLTIGVGRNIEDNGISEDEAIYLLKNDIRRCEEELQTFDWYDDLPEGVKRGLLNMNFNLGFPTLKQFTGMLSALKVRDFETAAEEALDSRWAKQVGARAVRISELFRQGN